MKKYAVCILFLCAGHSAYGVGEFPVSTSINHQLRPAVASSGNNYLVVWHSYHTAATAPDIWGRIVTINGDPLDSFPICEIAGNQTFPNVAWCIDKYLVIWDHQGQEIWGQLVDVNGVLVGSAFQIASGLNTIGEPTIASNGNNYLVVWTDALNLSGRMVSSGGSPVGSAFMISNAADTQFYPRAIAAGDNYLVAWPDFRTGGWNVYGQQVSSAGTLIGSNFSISSKTEPERRLALASCDTAVLVAWEEDQGWVGWDIHGIILDSTMNVLVSDFTICAAIWDQRLPCACWHKATGRFIVGWHDYRNSGNADIYIRWVEVTGSLGSEDQITAIAPEQRECDVGCSNTCYLIAWEDYRQGSGNIDVYGYVPSPCPVEERDYRLEIRDCRLEVYPNPFTTNTVIGFNSSRVSEVKDLKLQIYDINGRLIRNWKIENVKLQNVVWDGKDNNGNEVRSGQYFILPYGNPALIQKLIKL